MVPPLLSIHSVLSFAAHLRGPTDNEISILRRGRGEKEYKVAVMGTVGTPRRNRKYRYVKKVEGQVA